MNPMFMTNMPSSMEEIMIMNNEAATECNPSISLPLLIGLSRSTYAAGGNDSKNNKNGDNAATNSTDAANNNTASNIKDDSNTDDDKLIKIDPASSFPQTLHTLLSTPKYSSILSWMVHGRSFQIHDTTVFVTQILSQYFNTFTKNDQGVESDSGAVVEGGDGNEKQGAVTNAAENANTSIDDLQSFENELYKWGFKPYKGTTSTTSTTLSSKKSNNNKKKKAKKSKGAVVSSSSNKMKMLDVGSYYQQDFLRGQFDLLENMVYNNDNDKKEKKSEGKDEKNGDDKDQDEDEVKDEDGDIKMCNNDPPPPPPHSSSPEEDESLAESTSDDDDIAPPPPPQQHSEEVQAFLTFTNTSDPRIAIQYLEMTSNNNLEMAVSLFMDHGQPSAVALGLPPLGGGGSSGVGGSGGAASGGASSARSGAATSSKAAKNKSKGKDKDDKEEEEEEEEEEPDFYSLPFLPPLSLPLIEKKKKERRKILPAEKIVECALREYCAFRIIRRALLHWIHARRTRVDDGHAAVEASQLGFVLANKNHHHAQQLQDYGLGGTSHFLFQSLRHSSLPVRRAAARMILHNLHHIQQRHTTTASGAKEDEKSDGGDKKKSNNDGLKSSSSQGLQEALVILLHSLMFGETPYQHQSSQQRRGRMMMIPRTKNQAEGGDPALQIMGLLVSLVCDGGFSNILVGDEVKDMIQLNPTLGVVAGLGVPTTGYAMTTTTDNGDEDHGNILAKSILSEMSSDSIESFVAAGGLRWACGSIVRLVHMLIHGTGGNNDAATAGMMMMGGHNGGSDSDGNNSNHNNVQVDPMEDITSRTIQTRLLLLIDLVYRLVLFGSVPAAVDKHSSLSVTTIHDGGSGGDGGSGDGKNSSKKSSKSSSGDEAGKDSSSRASSRRLKSRELYEMLSRETAASSGETSRTSSHTLRQSLAAQSLRASIGNPPLTGASERASSRLKRGSRSAGGGGSLANLPSGGGGDDDPSSSMADENRRRKDRRRATLERVHKLFWSSTLPAAVCLPPMSDLTSPTIINATHEESPTALGELTPLACLIAAYEILRSHPKSQSTLSTNSQLRTLEKGIAILGRIVDPGAGNAVVTVDGDLPWGLAGILGDNAKAFEYGIKEKKSRKRDRSSSHDRSRSSSASRASRLASGESPTRNAMGHRAKRSRTSGSVASLLERLTNAEAASAGASGGATSSSMSAAQSAMDSALAASSLQAAGAIRSGGRSSLAADRYRSVMESMMLRGTGGGASSSSAAAGAAARADRDGSINRILASVAARADASPATSQRDRDASLSRLLASGSTTASPGRAGGEPDPEEWRVLHALPEGMDVEDDMEIIDNEGGESGDMDESNDNNNGDGDNSDEDDSDADSAAMDDEIVDIDGNNPRESNNNNDDEDSDDDGYNEDNDEEVYDTSQFDDAVINLEEIETLTSSNAQPDAHHSNEGTGQSQKNPHRHSSTTRSPAVSRSNSSSGTSGLSPVELALKKREREQAFLCAAISILAAQYPQLLGSKNGHGSRQHMMITQVASKSNRFSIFSSPAANITPPLLTINAEQSLLQSLCNIVKPPRKKLNLKIFLRRAPTQEEFFRGNLSKNPIGLSSLKAAGASSSSGGDDRRTSSGGNSGNDEPLVSDLRLHIAKDLQMEDSAELLELLVANKILDMNLKLRVVQQVLWKKYVEENATSASSAGVAGAGPSHQMISTGNGLSMIFSNSGLLAARNRGSGAAGSNVADDNAILASFPPMVVTYRLAGVDGEATEDNVEVADIEDPEAPSSANSTPAAIERRTEKEFGITRMITQHHGVAVLLASVQGTISDLLRRIRRDEVARRRMLRNIAGAEDPSATANNEDGNTTREQLAKSPPCPGLKLLRLCANIPDNRKKMLANRAPTLLLRILLDILNAMNRSSDDGNRKGRRKRSSTIDFSSHSSMDVDLSDLPTAPSSTRNRVHHVEGNPTTEALQEIIEMLASDISAEISDETSSSKKAKKKSLKSPGSFVNLSSQADADEAAVGGQQSEEDRTLPLVLKSLHSTELSPPLRKVIAKLLPFLTYGQVESSRELASYFCKYVNVSRLGTLNTEASSEYAGNALMNTFVDTAINLPPVSVCDNLRTELIYNGFVNSLRAFLLEDAPRLPPPWSPALFSKSSKKLSDKKSSELKEEWRNYFDRPGLSSAFKILTGLCSGHDATQLLLSDIPDYEGGVGSKENNEDELNLLTLCHWMESTSDNTASDIKNPNGILAETFLDALKEDNEVTSEKINAIRKKLRDRKRELAEERRNKALVGMSAFGTLTGSAVSSSTAAQGGNAESAESRSMFGGLFSSLLAAPSAAASSSTRTTRATSAKADAASQPKAKPSWMDEMEAMADEAGATCAVCQEGRTLQPSELLGMYAYMKKVTISPSQGGGKGDVDGTVMLLSLPTSFPNALTGSTEMESLFTTARRAANALEGSSHAISAMSASSQSRSNYYITTVSAGNAIHCTCHKKARTADRNHPKAPKSEWEGASLRNSRVTCNVILPLVSSKTTEVSLMAVETALAEYNTIVTNTLGARPKSILWNSLNDVRFLLLRMAHGESLGADCGGGSSSSNFLLLLYELYSADMFAQDAEHDESLEVSRHARGLSAGYLVGVDIVDDVSFERIDSRSRKLERGVADSAPMSALLSILFYNMDDKPASGKKIHDISGSSESKQTPSPTRQWQTHKSKFLAGLIRCAGRRHSLGLTDSGCVTSRGISTGKKNVEKARSFLDWTSDEARASKSSHRNTMIEEYSEALRPMITLYAIFDQLSKEFVLNNDDESTEESSERLAAKLESCYKADSVQELLRIADINVGNDVVCKYFEKGATS